MDPITTHSNNVGAYASIVRSHPFIDLGSLWGALRRNQS